MKLDVKSSNIDLRFSIGTFIVECSARAIADHGYFAVGFAGGSAATIVCECFQQAEFSESVDWSKWKIFICDERYVDLSDPDSNFKSIYDGLIVKHSILQENIFKMNKLGSIAEAALDYEEQMKKVFHTDGFPCFDLLVLGMGPDGHICSLFPNHELLNEESKWVSYLEDSPKPPPPRITFTLNVVNNANCVLFVVTGESKAEKVNENTTDVIGCTKDTDTKDMSKFDNHVFRWRSSQPFQLNTEFLGSKFSLPPNNVNTLTPLNYFEMFWKHEINKHISDETNLYSVQKTSRSINTTVKEIEQFIGMHIYMSFVKTPSYAMYWASATRYPLIADVMSLNRYKKLRQFLHLNDNSKKYQNDVNTNNKLFKVQPILDHIRNNCILIEPEVEQSIDEQIIPAKTKRSGIRQYNPKKPTKWGFKNYVRSGASGFMYDFFLYSGAANKNVKCNGSYCVLKLIETLPKNSNFKLFFDNWFSSLQLCLRLKEMGFLVTSTIRSDRIENCSLPTEKDLKKSGRGSHAYKTDVNSNIVITKWYDNKCVHMCSNYVDPKSVCSVQRWDRKEKKFVTINCPEVVRQYNKSMGGVDLSDMLISLYRTSYKTKHWYLKVLFHCVDIAKVNAWLLYRRHCNQLHIPQKN